MLGCAKLQCTMSRTPVETTVRNTVRAVSVQAILCTRMVFLCVDPILCRIPDKLDGVAATALTFLGSLVLPFIDTSQTQS